MGYVQELVYGRIKNGKSYPNFGHWLGNDWNGDPHPAVSTDPSLSEPKKPRQTHYRTKPGSAGCDGRKQCEECQGKISGKKLKSDEQKS